MKKTLAGVDEVGRGSLIGPVFAAAVILNNDINKKILKDSKSLSKNKYGIFEPTKINHSIPDIIFVPMLGFDKNLNRIGYGKGYYDKTISKLRNLKKIFVIGLAYDNQMLKSIPIENHDEKMDLIITDKKIYR